MTGREGAPADHTRPDEQAVAEALAEMRQHPQWVEKLGDVSKVIVRAALAAGPDEPWAAPPGLPATLSTPDDVAAVCRAEQVPEQPRGRDHRAWGDNTVTVAARAFTVTVADVASLAYEVPASLLVAAIRAARATGGGDRD